MAAEQDEPGAVDAEEVELMINTCKAELRKDLISKTIHEELKKRVIGCETQIRNALEDAARLEDKLKQTNQDVDGHRVLHRESGNQIHELQNLTTKLEDQLKYKTDSDELENLSFTINEIVAKINELQAGGAISSGATAAKFEPVATY